MSDSLLASRPFIPASGDSLSAGVLGASFPGSGFVSAVPFLVGVISGVAANFFAGGSGSGLVRLVIVSFFVSTVVFDVLSFLSTGCVGFGVFSVGLGAAFSDSLVSGCVGVGVFSLGLGVSFSGSLGVGVGFRASLVIGVALSSILDPVVLGTSSMWFVESVCRRCEIVCN